MAASSSSGKGKGKTRYPQGVCWNCGEKGHYKDKCPELTTDKPTKEPKKEVVPKKLESANTVESDSESKAAFLMLYDLDSVESDGCGNGDWFDEVVMLDSEESDWFSDGEVDESIPDVLENHSLDNPNPLDAPDVAQVAAELASHEDCRDERSAHLLAR